MSSQPKWKSLPVPAETHKRTKSVAAKRGEGLGEFAGKVLNHYCAIEEEAKATAKNQPASPAAFGKVS